MTFIYTDDRLGFVEVESDTAWMMDDFGNLIQVPFSIPQYYWQSV